MILTNIDAIKKLHSLECKSTSNKYIAICKKRIESNNTLWIPGDIESYLNSEFDKEYWDNYPMYDVNDAIECLLKNEVEITLTSKYIRFIKDDICKTFKVKNYSSLSNLLKFSIEEFITHEL